MLSNLLRRIKSGSGSHRLTTDSITPPLGSGTQSTKTVEYILSMNTTSQDKLLTTMHEECMRLIKNLDALPNTTLVTLRYEVVIRLLELVSTRNTSNTVFQS